MVVVFVGGPFVYVVLCHCFFCQLWGKKKVKFCTIKTRVIWVSIMGFDYMQSDDIILATNPFSLSR